MNKIMKGRPLVCGARITGGAEQRRWGGEEFTVTVRLADDVYGPSEPSGDAPNVCLDAVFFSRMIYCLVAVWVRGL